MAVSDGPRPRVLDGGGLIMGTGPGMTGSHEHRQNISDQEP